MSVVSASVPPPLTSEGLPPYVVTQGAEYTLSRRLTRWELLALLMDCQDGRATCLYTLKVFEAQCIMRHERVAGRV